MEWVARRCLIILKANPPPTASPDQSTKNSSPTPKKRSFFSISRTLLTVDYLLHLRSLKTSSWRLYKDRLERSGYDGSANDIKIVLRVSTFSQLISRERLQIILSTLSSSTSLYKVSHLVSPWNLISQAWLLTSLSSSTKRSRSTASPPPTSITSTRKDSSLVSAVPQSELSQLDSFVQRRSKGQVRIEAASSSLSLLQSA